MSWQVRCCSRRLCCSALPRVGGRHRLQRAHRHPPIRCGRWWTVGNTNRPTRWVQRFSLSTKAAQASTSTSGCLHWKAGTIRMPPLRLSGRLFRARISRAFAWSWRARSSLPTTLQRRVRRSRVCWTKIRRRKCGRTCSRISRAWTRSSETRAVSSASSLRRHQATTTTSIARPA